MTITFQVTGILNNKMENKELLLASNNFRLTKKYLSQPKLPSTVS